MKTNDHLLARIAIYLSNFHVEARHLTGLKNLWVSDLLSRHLEANEDKEYIPLQQRSGDLLFSVISIPENFKIPPETFKRYMTEAGLPDPFLTKPKKKNKKNMIVTTEK